MEVNSLYIQDIKAMGLKLLGSSLEPFLYIRMVVDCFQESGIFFSSKHLLKIKPSTLQLGSTIFRCLYSTLSLPGAELDMHLSLSLISLLDIGSISD